MPIRPELRWLYPIDWKELSAVIRFRRAGGRCERCGRPHLRVVDDLGDGRWWDEGTGSWRNGRGRAIGPPAFGDHARLRRTRVVLTTAHLDHDPTNNRPRNLKALCQRCHLAHDRAEHRRRIRLRSRGGRGLTRTSSGWRSRPIRTRTRPGCRGYSGSRPELSPARPAAEPIPRRHIDGAGGPRKCRHDAEPVPGMGRRDRPEYER
jgi:hypothetical protein